VTWFVCFGVVRRLAGVIKCREIHFDHETQYILHTYTLGLNDITSVEGEHDLGIVTHELLKPSSQCAIAAKSAN